MSVLATEATVQHQILAPEVEQVENQAEDATPKCLDGSQDRVEVEVSIVESAISAIALVETEEEATPVSDDPSSSPQIEEPEPDGPIEPSQSLSSIPQAPYPVPEDLDVEWGEINVMDDAQVSVAISLIV